MSADGQARSMQIKKIAAAESTGVVALPGDFPVISFPVGKDMATVVPIPCP